MYGFGDGSYGKLAQKAHFVVTPIRIQFFSEIQIKQVVSGFFQTIFLSYDNQLFRCGNVRKRLRSEMGIKTPSWVPEKIQGLEGLKVKQVAVGDYHVIVVAGNIELE